MLDKFYITPKQWLHILRWSLYALLFLVAMMVQTVVFGNRSLFGAKPLFVPVVIACVCLREGAERGGLFALLASLFWCFSGADYGALSIVMMTVVPVLGTVGSRAVLSSRYIPCLLITFFTLLLEQGTVFAMELFFGSAKPGLFFTALLPCVFVSLLSQPIIYFLVKQIERIGDPYESA